MYEIQGETNVILYEEYSYNLVPSDCTSYSWLITGGNIISGQGSQSIVVVWDIVGPGQVQVTAQPPSGDQIIVVIDTMAG